jgi:glucose uptake protein GlcU
MTGSHSHFVQVIGTIAIALLAVGLILVAAEAQRFSRYGREALLVTGCYLLAAAVVRMLALDNWITQTSAREINGLLAWVALVVLAQIIFLQRREHHALNGSREREVKR